MNQIGALSAWTAPRLGITELWRAAIGSWCRFCIRRSGIIGIILNARPAIALRRLMPRSHLSPEEQHHPDQEGDADNQGRGQCRKILEQRWLLPAGVQCAPHWHCVSPPAMAAPSARRGTNQVPRQPGLRPARHVTGSGRHVPCRPPHPLPLFARVQQEL